MPEIKRKATLDNLPPMMAFVQEFATSRGLSAEILRQIELALEEALVNIIKYAYPDAPGNVEIHCDHDAESGLLIEIIDDGEPFNLLAREDPNTSLALADRQIGGLGIFLLKKMMDQTRYRREEGRNVLTLVKHL